MKLNGATLDKENPTNKDDFNKNLSVTAALNFHQRMSMHQIWLQVLGCNTNATFKNMCVLLKYLPQ